MLRFATLGVQSYHHDEIVTASRILRDGFWHAMDAVGFSESAPPLYYAIAWLWTQLTGTGEFGLRSVSALAGVATVPVAYLLGAELSSRRAGIVAAALVAVNPMLLWYSQEARAYALFVLLTALSLLYFVRGPRPRPPPRLDRLGGGFGAGPRHALLRRLPDRRRGALAAATPGQGERRCLPGPLDRRRRRACCWRRWSSTRRPSPTPNGSATSASGTASGRPG